MEARERTKITWHMGDNLFLRIYLLKKYGYHAFEIHVQKKHILFEAIYLPGLLAGPSGIRVGWVIETNGRLEAEILPTSVGPPSGGRAAFFAPLV